jgi:hypothetical protein
MQKVLARRDVNRATLDKYVLDEVERFAILGPGRTPLHRFERDYTWYVRDGIHVRSPVRFNGVAVGEDARGRYEADWLERERKRRERRARRAGGDAPRDEPNPLAEPADPAGPPGAAAGLPAAPAAPAEADDPPLGAGAATEPRFVSEAYFMDFKFEPGNYYLAGRDRIEGHDVLTIEYYPTRLFDGERERENERGRERQRERDTPEEQAIDRKMNKTALVTLWVDPAEHQIVKYTFDNVWLDFLPGAWLVRMDGIRASMTMGQPFAGVWLPRAIDIQAGVSLASGSFEVAYTRAFSQYRLAEVTTRVGPPKVSRRPGAAAPASAPARLSGASLAAPVGPEPAGRGRGPFVRNEEPLLEDDGRRAQETIGEIRVHGNVVLTDAEVIALAGVAAGQSFPANGVAAVTERLEESDRFDSIDVRKRYRSLTETADGALGLVVHEKPGVRSSAPSGAAEPARSAGRLRSRLMFLPIVSFADGYGFTYGGRVSTLDLLGLDERLSVPLTWGGTRRAAFELERLFDRGPLTRVESSVAIWNRGNPRFDIREQRVEVKGRAERVLGDIFRAGVEASRSRIDFGDLRDRLWTLGTTAAVDTRLDPAYPANAVFLHASWTGLHFDRIPGRVNRVAGDVRGYLRAIGQVVVAGRAQYAGADAALPPYERLLLGGSSSLRGFSAGSFDGDRMLTAAAEVRVPVTSVLNGIKLGLTGFVDAGTVWNAGDRREDAVWRQGVGAGLFLIASVVRINLDVARGLDGGRTRVHLSSGFTF